MKTFLSITFLIATLVAGTLLSAEAPFYYSDNREIPLRIDSSRVVIKFSNLDESQLEAWAGDIGRINALLDDDHAKDGYHAFSLSYKSNYDAFLDSLSMLPDVDLVEPYYLNLSDSAHLAGERFCVAFRESVTRDQIDSINLEHGVAMGYPVALMGNVFTLRNTKASLMRTLDIANSYYNLKATIFSHPLFGVAPVQTSYWIFDEYHIYQPHLKKVIGSFNDRSVWDFHGLTDPVVVAVVDDGVTSHEDLPA